MTTSKRKAIALLSGGLDSLLAAKIVSDQGIEVIGLHLLSPFGCRDDVEKTAASIGAKLIVKEKGEAYLDLVKDPRYGYGKNMNPCVDCRIFMFQIAEKVMHDEGADFIVTGEVMGQRPMSQTKHAMDLIDRKSGIDDLVLRPLSAGMMKPSLPEREGWVNREEMYSITGRTRKEQVVLTQKLGLSEFKAPGGGCLLTEKEFAPRLKDFYENPHYRSSSERLGQSEILRFGRHFRLHDRLKVIISRDANENNALGERWNRAGGSLFFPSNFLGPIAVAIGTVEDSDRKIIGEMIARYGKATQVPYEIGYESSETRGTFAVETRTSDDFLESRRL